MNNKHIERIHAHLRRNKTERQFVLFMFYGFFALIAELLARFGCDIAFKKLDFMLNIWPFPEQALGSFLAFMISNLLAKTISYVLNRKKTFQANNSAIWSGTVYALLCLVLLIIETIVGTPLQNKLYFLFGGRYNDPDFSTVSALRPGLYQLCGTLSQIIYCSVDSVIMFVMNKYVIMKRHGE